MPESVWPEFKARVNAVYHAPGRAIARDLAKGVVAGFERELPTAVSCFLDDFEACIAHQRMPINHDRAIRTTNLLERLFAEERRRLKVIPNAFGERAVLKLMLAATWRAATRWKPIRVLEFEARQLELIRVELSEEYEKSTGFPAASRRAAPHAKLSSKIGT